MITVYLSDRIMLDILDRSLKDTVDVYPHRDLRSVCKRFCILVSSIEISECSKSIVVRQSQQETFYYLYHSISEEKHRNRVESQMHVNHFIAAAIMTRLLRAQMYLMKYAKGTVDCISYGTEWYTFENDDDFVICRTVKRAAALWRNALQETVWKFSFMLRKPRKETWQVQINNGNVQCIVQMRLLSSYVSV